MAAPWFESNSDWFEHQKVEVGMHHIYLEWVNRSRSMYLEGPFIVSHPETGQEFDQFEISIAFPHNFPRDLPRVWEVGGRIPRIMDRHIYPVSGACCLFVDEAFWLRHPDGYTVLEYLDEPIHHYFLAQVYYELNGTWPWGDRSHELEGILEEYNQIFKIDDRRIIPEFIRCLSRGPIKGHWTCPCGSGKQLRKCCGDLLRSVQARIPLARLEATWRLFERAGEERVQRAIDNMRVE